MAFPGCSKQTFEHKKDADNWTLLISQSTLTDHLNTVRDIAKYNSQTDTTTVVNHLVYDAFGKVTSETNPAVDSLFLFTARPFDPDTQLQNNLNRWYDARVGRWLSEDPVGFAGGDGNLYRYVGNGPSGRFDPVGLREPEDPFDAVMLGIITPQEAQYFYNRSREELREYIKWRLREGRDAIQVTDPPASTKFPIGRKPLGWVLAQLWPLPGERCARCGPEQLRELGEAIERVAKNTWIFDFWPNGCERWAMAFERNWADAKVCSPCLAEHNIGFRTASAIGGGHAYYYFLLCDRVTTVRVDHWIYQFFAYGGTTCFEIVR